MNEQNYERLPVMDGLRGISIFAVMYQHFFCPMLSSYFVPGFPEVPAPYFSFGWLAVNLFFIHSGFVLYRPYADKIREMSFSDFYRRRFFRLMPLFAFMILVATLLRPLTAEVRIQEALLALTTLNLYTFYHWFSPLNGSWWSIGLELTFSLLFPLLWLASRKSSAWKLYAYVALLAFFVRMQGAGFEFKDSFNLNPIKDSFLGRLDDFVLGFALYETYRSGKVKVPSAILFLVGAALFVLTVHGWDQRNLGVLNAIEIAALHNLAQAAFFLMSLAALQSAGLLKRVLCLWPIRLAGAMCFSLYLWHGVIAGSLLEGWEESGWAIGYLLFTTAALSAFTYRYIEFGRIRDWRALFLLEPKKGDDGSILSA